jgi:hypothetical protein
LTAIVANTIREDEYKESRNGNNEVGVLISKDSSIFKPSRESHVILGILLWVLGVLSFIYSLGSLYDGRTILSVMSFLAASLEIWFGFWFFV